MKCEVCGLDNDPSLDYCDNCEHPLREAPTAVVPVPRSAAPRSPAPRPVPVAARDEDDEVPAEDGFQDRLVEPRPLARPVLVGVAVLTLAGAVSGVALARRHSDTPDGPPGVVVAESSVATVPSTDDPATTSPTVAAADPQAQGAAMDQLLDRSKRSRDKLNRAIKSVEGCTGLAGAISGLREAGDERGAERDTLAALDLSAFPAGEQARSALKSAFEHSLAADRYYVQWAEEKQRNGCRNTAATRRLDAAADDKSTAAGEAKEEFLAVWNPIAQQLGLPIRDRQGI
ncbi:hypothetical protein GCM10010168_62070 [Actinoplanes ianthinogenes]|uniref:Zinc ribbon domain-containing protein n=1 Tax=Actinoplanes ianthinogenes TaxID=122358 RepID=A0ABM7M4K1_9ACTN|nr:zinc finger Ran-binding domain-containing protein [Actinoplanes ianthinogenes]BCJ46568.1 hypothetical protein Aiant_72250 [Actinoplanes ianthinogenes]GGR35160.1 hypothetical protein GCM10010168_62070 [Actinoplanes ianthinogenes]